MTISRRFKQYIDNYNRIYKRVLKEAKQRENDRLLLKATNKPKVIWKIIKNEIDKSTNSMQDIQSDKINDLHKIADLFNTFFCETPTKLLRNNKINNSLPPDKHRMNIKRCNKSLFFSPITENEVVKLAEFKK